MGREQSWPEKGGKMLNPFYGLWVIIASGIGALIIFKIKMNSPDSHIWAVFRR